MWYYFSVASIDNEGNMDIHTDLSVIQYPFFGEVPNSEGKNRLRKLSNDLYDLPGPSNHLWSGYVQADTELLAYEKVSQEY